MRTKGIETYPGGQRSRQSPVVEYTFGALQVLSHNSESQVGTIQRARKGEVCAAQTRSHVRAGVRSADDAALGHVGLEWRRNHRSYRKGCQLRATFRGAETRRPCDSNVDVVLLSVDLRIGDFREGLVRSCRDVAVRSFNAVPLPKVDREEFPELVAVALRETSRRVGFVVLGPSNNPTGISWTIVVGAREALCCERSSEEGKSEHLVGEGSKLIFYFSKK